MKWNRSQSQQNMQTINETPAEAFVRLQNELMALLIAASGEGTGSLHSALGHWRQKVNALLAQSVEISQTAFIASGGATGRSFGQVGYLTTDTSGGVPSGPGQAGLAEGSDVIFNGTPFGNLAYSDSVLGAFTLLPNRNYLLSAVFELTYSDPDAFASIFWVEANTNTVLRDSVGSADDGGYDATEYSGNSKAQLLYTTGDTPLMVKLRVLSLSVGTLDVLYGSNALIHEV